MKSIFNLILILTCLSSRAQTPDPQVINAAGSHRTDGVTGISITDNVGEPFTQTQMAPSNNMMITEGYLQPIVVAPGFNATVIKNNLSCSDKKDGSIAIEITTDHSSYSASYSWTPASICPGNDCASVDSLSVGTYSVLIRMTYTNSAGVVRQDSVLKTITIEDLAGPCLLTIYNGFTPNSDGVNDNWVIGNIESFPNNTVTIYNRWGKELYAVKGYDNKTNSWWPDEKLVSSTYFYVIDLGDGSKPIKGWVELIKN